MSNDSYQLNILLILKKFIGAGIPVTHHMVLPRNANTPL